MRYYFLFYFIYLNDKFNSISSLCVYVCEERRIFFFDATFFLSLLWPFLLSFCPYSFTPIILNRWCGCAFSFFLFSLFFPSQKENKGWIAETQRHTLSHLHSQQTMSYMGLQNHVLPVNWKRGKENRRKARKRKRERERERWVCDAGKRVFGMSRSIFCPVFAIWMTFARLSETGPTPYSLAVIHWSWVSPYLHESTLRFAFDFNFDTGLLRGRSHGWRLCIGWYHILPRRVSE